LQLNTSSSQVSVGDGWNVAEDVTIYIDWVQRFNFSSANGSISFIAPESAANNRYARIVVSDEMGAETVTPDKLYYSDKVRFPCASVCLVVRHERARHDGLGIMRFACEASAAGIAVRKRWRLWRRPGMLALPEGPCPPFFCPLLRCAAVFSLVPAPAGCHLSWRFPPLAHARVLEPRGCTHPLQTNSSRARYRAMTSRKRAFCAT
jgi:hypothetical protein